MRLGDATTVTAVYYYYCNFLFDLMTFIEVTEFKVEGDAPLVIGTCPILTLLVQFFCLLYQDHGKQLQKVDVFLSSEFVVCGNHVVSYCVSFQCGVWNMTG